MMLDSGKFVVDERPRYEFEGGFLCGKCVSGLYFLLSTIRLLDYSRILGCSC